MQKTMRNLRLLIFILVSCVSFGKTVSAETAPAIRIDMCGENVTDAATMEDESVSDFVKIDVNAKEYYSEAFKVLDLVNKERKKHGKSALVMDDELLDTAMQRAYETVLHWDHERPCSLDCFSINSRIYGENIAWGHTSAASVMNAWINSPGHKDNILRDYKSIGIGCVKFNGTYYWVQCFGYDKKNSAVASKYKDKDKTRTVSVAKHSNYYKAKFSLAKQELKVGETLSPTVKWNNMDLKNSGVVVESSNPSVCKISDGKIVAVGEGTTTIKIYYPTWKSNCKKFKLTVTSQSKVTATRILKTAKKGTSVTVTWEKISNISGYEIQYATDSKFKKNVKKVNIGKKSTQKKKISKLKKGKTYYIRIRTYKKSSGKKLYSSWSKVKKIKLK